MADFKTHTLFGSIIAIISIIFSITNNFVKEVYLYFLVYIFTIIGSYLPDLDSDSGKPIKIVFNFFSLLSLLVYVFLVFYYFNLKWKDFILLGIIILIFVRYVVSYFFKKLTKHRGIYHSIPMMFISFFVSFSILKNIDKFGLDVSFYLSSMVTFGFFSHLVLDEIFATKTFAGIPYKTNKSFGNSIKLKTKSKKVTFLTYLLLILLILVNYDSLKESINIIFSK